jgi:hypothetical protein
VLFMLVAASANDARFGQQLNLLVVLNGIIVVVLVLLVGREVWRLWRNRRKGVFGARLATRLVGFFALMAILPGALLYGVSVAFLGNSIESWFNVKVDRALEAGDPARPHRARLPAAGSGKKGPADGAGACRGRSGRAVAAAEPAARAGRRRRCALYDLRGNVIAFSATTLTAMRPEPIPARAIARARMQLLDERRVACRIRGSCCARSSR